MKIAIACRSVLLEKSLQKFLKNYIVSADSADIVITDRSICSDRPIFRIGVSKESDLKKPFSKSQLMIRLEEKLQRYAQKEKIHAIYKEESEPKESLEKKIKILTNRFIMELTETIKEHYEKNK